MLCPWNEHEAGTGTGTGTGTHGHGTIQVIHSRPRPDWVCPASANAPVFPGIELKERQPHVSLSTMETDPELAAQLRSDLDSERRAAWEAVYARHQPKVLALATHITGNPALAEEIGQETFLQVYRHAASYRGEGSLEAWVLRIATNLCRRVLVRERVLREKLQDRAGVEQTFGEPPGQRLEAAEDRAAVHRALESLSPEHRIAVTLSCFDGLSGEEIAAIMGCPVGTVWSRIHHAKKRLADMIGTDRGRNDDEPS